MGEGDVMLATCGMFQSTLHQRLALQVRVPLMLEAVSSPWSPNLCSALGLLRTYVYSIGLPLRHVLQSLQGQGSSGVPDSATPQSRYHTVIFVEINRDGSGYIHHVVGSSAFFQGIWKMLFRNPIVYSTVKKPLP